MLKKYIKLFVVVGAIVGLTACGKAVEIPPANVGKIQTKDGFQQDVRMPSKFRLPFCMTYCDKLVTLDVSDQRYTEGFNTFMPKDDLNLEYAVSMTLAVDPDKYDFVFGNVPARNIEDRLSKVEQQDVYRRYAESKVETILPEIVAEFKISEIASDRGKVNTFIRQRLNKELKTTPFIVKHVGLTEVKYPDIITKAKENAAERREREQQIEAQRRLDLLQIETDKEVEKQRREVELMQAATKRMIAENMMSKEYETLLKYETLKELAKSNNKVIVPTEMLDGLAVQQEVK